MAQCNRLYACCQLRASPGACAVQQDAGVSVGSAHAEALRGDLLCAAEYGTDLAQLFSLRASEPHSACLR